MWLNLDREDHGRGDQSVSVFLWLYGPSPSDEYACLDRGEGLCKG